MASLLDAYLSREAAGENDTYGFALMSAPGQVAGAASYTNGLAAHHVCRPARPRSPRAPVPEHTSSYDVGAGCHRGSGSILMPVHIKGLNCDSGYRAPARSHDAFLEPDRTRRLSW